MRDREIGTERDRVRERDCEKDRDEERKGRETFKKEKYPMNRKDRKRYSSKCVNKIKKKKGNISHMRQGNEKKDKHTDGDREIDRDGEMEE